MFGVYKAACLSATLVALLGFSAKADTVTHVVDMAYTGLSGDALSEYYLRQSGMTFDRVRQTTGGVLASTVYDDGELSPGVPQSQSMVLYFPGWRQVDQTSIIVNGIGERDFAGRAYDAVSGGTLLSSRNISIASGCGPNNVHTVTLTAGASSIARVEGYQPQYNVNSCIDRYNYGGVTVTGTPVQAELGGDLDGGTHDLGTQMLDGLTLDFTLSNLTPDDEALPLELIGLTIEDISLTGDWASYFTLASSSLVGSVLDKDAQALLSLVPREDVVFSEAQALTGGISLTVDEGNLVGSHTVTTQFYAEILNPVPAEDDPSEISAPTTFLGVLTGLLGLAFLRWRYRGRMLRLQHAFARS